MNEIMPDRIYAVGGGGIRLVLTLFQQDWVMEEVIRPREGDAENVEVYLFDTALDETGPIQQELRELRTRCKELEDQFDDHRYGEVGNVNFNAKVITEGLNLTTSLDLTEPSIVERIAQDQQFDAEDWWIDQGDVDENLDFSTGVYRRRALARATYFRADADDASLSNDIDMPSNGNAAVVVGLGGGTGSGLCIDFGRRLVERSPASDISLFGVLPSPEEDDRVRANAYAALSELEHVQLGGSHGAANGTDAMFKDVLLFPIDPTDYEGKKGDRLGTAAQLQEFDKAFTYPFLSYYNTNDTEELFDAAPEYAPFTMAVPQVLRYSVDAMRKARESLSESITHLTAKYQAGREIHDSAQDFLHDQFSEPADEDLTDSQRQELEGRLADLESFIGTDLFHEQGYVSAGQFEQDLMAGARERGDGEIDQTIRTLETLSDGFSDRNIEFVNETDEALADLIEVGSAFLGTRLRTLQQVSTIDDRTLYKAITTTLDVGRTDINTVKLKKNRVEDGRDELAREATVLGTELDEAERELEEARAEQSEKIERRVATWQSQTQPQRDRLRRADDVDITGLFDGLEGALEEYADAVQSKDTERAVDEISQARVKEALDTLESNLSRLGLDEALRAGGTELVQRSAVELSLDTLKKARKASLQTDADGGLLSKLWKTKEDKRAEEAENRLRDKRGVIRREGVFDVSGVEASMFWAKLSYSSDRAVGEVRNHLESNREQMINELDAIVDGGLGQSTREEMFRVIESGQFDDAAQVAEEAIETDLAVAEELTQTSEELKSQLSKTESELALYEATLAELDVNSTGGPRQDYERATSAFDQAHERYDQVGDNVTTDDDHLYIKRVQPRENITQQESSDIATAELLDRDGERSRAKRIIDEFARQSLEHSYLSLQERRLQDGAERYRGTKVSVGVLSRAATEDIGEIVRLSDSYEQAFGIQDYGSWHEPIGDSWDIGISVFVSGVFMDNLRNISEYRSGYEERRNEARSIHLHHALGLEDGALIRRAELLTMRDKEDIAHLTGRPNEQAVTEQFMQSSEQLSIETARTEQVELGGGDPPSEYEAGEDDSAKSTLETDGGDE
jgi:hypothetical protein